jgi:hypothetical protein
MENRKEVEIKEGEYLIPIDAKGNIQEGEHALTPAKQEELEILIPIDETNPLSAYPAHMQPEQPQNAAKRAETQKSHQDLNDSEPRNPRIPKQVVVESRSLFQKLFTKGREFFFGKPVRNGTLVPEGATLESAKSGVKRPSPSKQIEYHSLNEAESKELKELEEFVFARAIELLYPEKGEEYSEMLKDLAVKGGLDAVLDKMIADIAVLARGEYSQEEIGTQRKELEKLYRENLRATKKAKAPTSVKNEEIVIDDNSTSRQAAERAAKREPKIGLDAEGKILPLEKYVSAALTRLLNSKSGLYRVAIVRIHNSEGMEKAVDVAVKNLADRSEGTYSEELVRQQKEVIQQLISEKLQGKEVSSPLEELNTKDRETTRRRSHPGAGGRGSRRTDKISGNTEK